MSNVIRPWRGASSDPVAWTDEIRDLYTVSDMDAVRLGLEPDARKPLSCPDDISLMDDVLDALADPQQAKMARPVLRHALKEIARAALLKPSQPRKS
ncbi:hypothetical protein [uncultured Algimonas sp.]|uniref:hypothetical protein n=1 Tax=uncultured Algimonas sp. TaxID=1547920 RepID=UPI00260547D0|nr:hypothetical protein [uncultured Algimonas sp.]